MELFAKILKAAIIAKAPFWMNDRVLNTTLEGFVKDAPPEELAIAPVVAFFTTA